MRTLGIVVALAACSPTAKPPVAQPGMVVTLDDGVLRTRDDGSIEITVHRAFAGHEADGRVELHGVSVEEARRSPLIRVARGRAWLAIVQAIDDPAQAYAAATHGVDELGTDYEAGRHHINDDTDLALKRSRIAAEEQGDLPLAMKLLDRVMASRIRLYLEVYH